MPVVYPDDHEKKKSKAQGVPNLSNLLPSVIWDGAEASQHG